MNNVKIAIAAVGLVVLLIWLAVEAQAQAVCATQPDGSVLCCVTQPDGSQLCMSSISSTLTPFVPTSTPVPTAQPTLTPTPVPTVVIRPWKRFVYLPIVNRQELSRD